MIVSVTPNPAADLTLRPDALVDGASHPVPPAERRAGGKGLNVARVLAQLDIAHRAIAPVGEDDLAWFSADLDGVTTHLVPCPGSVRRTYAIVPRDGSATSILNERGEARDAAVWDAVLTAAAEAASAASVLAISGSVPQGPGPTNGADGIVPALVRAGRAAGVPVIADVSGDHLAAAAEAGADVLKPNRDEIRQTTGLDDPLAGARALQRAGAGSLVVSLGEEGMLGVSSDPAAPVLRARLGRVLVGNPTGAGDAAVAAIASAIGPDRLSFERDLPEILRRATAWSAAAVLAPLAGSIDPSHADLAREVEISPL